MASTKRKVVDGEPDGNENAKKLKQDGDVAVSTTLQSDLGMIQGPDDTAITELFNTLVWLINTFTGQYFQGAPYADARKKDQKAYFQSLVGSDYKKYLKSEDPGVKQAIIEAAIWNMLIDPLLRTPTKAFIDEMPELKVRASTSGFEEFYAWRSMTAHFLRNKKTVAWGEGGPKREEFVAVAVELLLDHSVVKHKDKLEGRLDEIADKACELAMAMARSRAGWVCAMKEPRINMLHGFKIKKDSMDDVELWNDGDEHSKTITVDLVQTPMLVKYGNTNGENYDNCVVVKNAQVVTMAKETTEETTGRDWAA